MRCFACAFNNPEACARIAHGQTARLKDSDFLAIPPDVGRNAPAPEFGGTSHLPAMGDDSSQPALTSALMMMVNTHSSVLALSLTRDSGNMMSSGGNIFAEPYPGDSRARHRILF